MIERTNVQVFLYTRKPEFKILILKRTEERGGFWQPISGGIEEGESTYDTIKREVFEETGFQDIEKVYDLDYNFTFKAPKSRKWMRDICFGVEIDSIFDVKLSEEHEEYMWCNENQAKEILIWKHNLIALDKLLQIIRNSRF
ncbi:MAG: NUDIX pyrophosphatase [Promethearchaeota archaeon]